MKPIINISFSGGRTSAYMAYMLKTHLSDEYDFVVTFANTGLEHPKTLEFVQNCDIHYGLKVVWLEAVVNQKKGIGTRYKKVTFDTASKNGEPFEAMIKKYGFPNQSYPHCTRELKLAPIYSYLKAEVGEYQSTAIGIRNDERRRVSDKALANKIIYPLVDMWPTDKIEILDFFKTQPFDLGIEEFEGNCLGCFKKSRKKQFLQIDKDPTAFDFFREMERKYQKDRVFFRGNMDTRALFELHRETRSSQLFDHFGNDYENGGCSESCEILPMK